MGLGSNIQPTPAVALGAYEMTPIDVAAGYTAFAANGLRSEPIFIRNVVSADGTSHETAVPQPRLVLDPRVAYLVTSLMEDVINHGTGYPVRALGFTAPAAGKTGTSRDGWFAGYTSNLLCVVWVGFDDNRDLGIAGGEAAAPIWGEFMKRAVALPSYRKTEAFDPPEGVVSELIDSQSGQLAAPSCPQTTTEYFIVGTEPTQYCGGQTAGSWLGHLFGKKDDNVPSPAASGAQAGQTQEQPAEQPEKKKGVLGRIFGIFGGSKQPADSSKPQQ
jgi:penicillin-binding protein 1B